MDAPRCLVCDEPILGVPSGPWAKIPGGSPARYVCAKDAAAEGHSAGPRKLLFRGELFFAWADGAWVHTDAPRLQYLYENARSS